MTVEVNNGLNEQKGDKITVSGGKGQEVPAEEKRCSRQKPDSTTKDGAEEEKKDLHQGSISHMVTRTSSRVAKRPKRDFSPPPSPPPKKPGILYSFMIVHWQPPKYTYKLQNICRLLHVTTC